uniref:COMM domain containing 10 n=1 Tax=Taeniopygia guttata TaxID=59729 RepID=A0A674HBJ6_TAEGU
MVGSSPMMGWNRTIPDVFLHQFHSVTRRVCAALSESGAAALGLARPPSGAGPRHSHGGSRRAGEQQVPALRRRRSRRAGPGRAGPCGARRGGAGRSGAGTATVPGLRGARARLTPLPPSSIRRAVSLLNAVDPGRFPRLLSRLLQKLHLKAESTFSEDEEEKLQIAFSLEKQDLHLVLETISFILEQAVYHNLKPASLQQQLQSIHLDQDKAEAFASVWAAAGQDTIEKFRQRVLTPQKLETVGWQLNLQMAESMQAKLKSPQAVLELGVSNEDSKERHKMQRNFYSLAH